MKDKLEVGIYVRTDDGICKIDKIETESFSTPAYHLDINDESFYHGESWFEDLKASHNIIDLIKPKDIILGNDGKLYQCWKVYKDYVFTYSKNKQGQTITLVDYQIDRVMCYEQFESMSYKLGDDK